MLNLYYATYFAMFEWYTRENGPADAPDAAKYATWAMLALVGTWAVIGTEALLFASFSIPIVLYADLDWPRFILYGWSFPLFLILNYFLFVKNGKGFRLVKEMRKRSTQKRRNVRIVGTLIAVGTLAGAILSTLLAPAV